MKIRIVVARDDWFPDWLPLRVTALLALPAPEPAPDDDMRLYEQEMWEAE